MNKNKLYWCCKQRKGIEIIEPKTHLSGSYMKEADETLENVFTATGKWKLITAYYACYNALYSLLMKCGIKCEIHDCTIELAEMFDFSNEQIKYVRHLKDKRIQAQYYLKDMTLNSEDEGKDFVLKCKEILSNLDTDKIKEKRSAIQELAK